MGDEEAVDLAADLVEAVDLAEEAADPVAEAADPAEVQSVVQGME